MKIINILKQHKINMTDIVAVAIVIAGAIRIFGDGEISSRLDNTTLLYLSSAAAVFMLRHTKTFKFGDLEVELQELKEEAKEANLRAAIAEDTLKVNVRPVPTEIHSSLANLASRIQPGNYNNDPWKGVFGGKSVDNTKGRILKAEVEPLRGSPEWYSVVLKLSTLPEAPALDGDVMFFLHDTFPNQKPVVEATNGTAILSLKAWGAFTAGVMADEGETKLEIDLADLDSAPMEFRMR